MTEKILCSKLKPLSSLQQKVFPSCGLKQMWSLWYMVVRRNRNGYAVQQSHLLMTRGSLLESIRWGFEIKVLLTTITSVQKEHLKLSAYFHWKPPLHLLWKSQILIAGWANHFLNRQNISSWVLYFVSWLVCWGVQCAHLNAMQKHNQTQHYQI